MCSSPWYQNESITNCEQHQVIQESHLVSLLIVVPLQVVEDGGAHQQVGEGDNDQGEGSDLVVMEIFIEIFSKLWAWQADYFNDWILK